MHSKPDFRRIFLEKRNAITPADHAVWSAECCKHVVQLVRTATEQPRVIAAYMPIAGEVDIMPALQELAASYALALPAVQPVSRMLAFRRWQPGDPLVKGQFGTQEPDKQAQAVKPDWLIVPLLAYGAQGQRLGYGGGYYDITLRHLRPHIRAIGVAFSLQYCPDIPIELSDELLDVVVTE